ncbi:Elongation factor 1-gamma [Trichinella spiralis]|uniref:Elongation factor 1-gamma n=1 Tax=Trichinella spiralis TaxID=6334 RepID=A0ABR3KLV0_TRISP
MAIAGTLYGDPNGFRAKKIITAAEFANKKIKVETLNKMKRNWAHPPSELLFVTNEGNQLFDCNSIACYLANPFHGSGGGDQFHDSEVLQWINMADSKILAPILSWVIPCLSAESYNNVYVTEAKAESLEAMGWLNEQLLSKTFLVGERISVVDIILACNVLPAYQHAIGDVPFLTVERIAPKDNKDGAKVQSKAKAKPAEAPKKEVEVDVEEKVAESDKKDPFAAFPKGKFDMDGFKRVYKLEKVFMSCNLITGMFQRLDKLRKNAFASVCLFGEDNNSTISGIWIWRGHELAFELSEDWQIDYESYSWSKLDPKDEKTKSLVNEYLKWEGKFDGKKFNQGKIFK